MNNPSSHVKLAYTLVRSRKFILIFVSLVALLFPIALISNSAGEQKGGFLSMTTLGSSMKADNYFPSNSTIDLADRISWYVMVSNGMNSSEYLAVRVKILNSTQTIPDDALNTPSPYPEVLEYRQLVPKNSTITIPLEWSIRDIEKQNGYVSVREVVINGEEIGNLDIKSSDGHNFRMLLELWRYDYDTGDFEFEWSSAHNKRSVWNQIWFNVKS